MGKSRAQIQNLGWKEMPTIDAVELREVLGCMKNRKDPDKESIVEEMLREMEESYWKKQFSCCSVSAYRRATYKIYGPKS